MGADYAKKWLISGVGIRDETLHGLRKAADTGAIDLPDGPAWFRGLVDQLYRTRWHVYAKRTFGGPAQVFSYLGRYTHRVGLANSRIRAVDDDGVTFTTRGEDTVTLAPVEFIRRFLQHVLPRGFVKIRHYGLSASVHASTKHVVAHRLLGPLPDLDVVDDGVDEHGDVLLAVGVYVVLLARAEAIPCPRCHTGRLLITDKGPDPP